MRVAKQGKLDYSKKNQSQFSTGRIHSYRAKLTEVREKNVRRNCDQFSFSVYFSLVQKGREILQSTAKFSNSYTVITEMRCIIIGHLLHWIIFDAIHTKLQRH